MNKDTVALLKAVRHLPDWRVTQISDGWMAWPPEGRPIPIHLSTSRVQRATSLRAQLRRAGAAL